MYTFMENDLFRGLNSAESNSYFLSHNEINEIEKQSIDKQLRAFYRGSFVLISFKEKGKRGFIVRDKNYKEITKDGWWDLFTLADVEVKEAGIYWCQCVDFNYSRDGYLKQIVHPLRMISSDMELSEDEQKLVWLATALIFEKNRRFPICDTREVFYTMEGFLKDRNLQPRDPESLLNILGINKFQEIGNYIGRDIINKIYDLKDEIISSYNKPGKVEREYYSYCKAIFDGLTTGKYPLIVKSINSAVNDGTNVETISEYLHSFKVTGEYPPLEYLVGIGLTDELKGISITLDLIERLSEKTVYSSFFPTKDDPITLLELAEEKKRNYASKKEKSSDTRKEERKAVRAAKKAAMKAAKEAKLAKKS